MSSSSAPLSRPVPPAPTATAPPPGPTSQQPPAPSVDDEVDLSTLRFLRTSLRTPYLPWLLRLSLFTLAAKLVRVLAPPLLRFVARLTAWTWAALTAVVRFAAWASMWSGVVALAAWLLVGLGAAAVYVALSAKPHVRRWARERPAQATLARKAAVGAAAWGGVRWVAGKSAGKAVVVGYAGWEAWAFAARGNKGQGARAATAEPVVAVSSSSSPEEDQPAGNAAAQRSSRDAARPPSGDDVDVDVDDAELERWARQAKEALLRDSLLRQGRKAGGTGARADSAADDGRGYDGLEGGVGESGVEGGAVASTTTAKDAGGARDERAGSGSLAL